MPSPTRQAVLTEMHMADNEGSIHISLHLVLLDASNVALTSIALLALLCSVRAFGRRSCSASLVCRRQLARSSCSSEKSRPSRRSRTTSILPSSSSLSLLPGLQYDSYLHRWGRHGEILDDSCIFFVSGIIANRFIHSIFSEVWSW